MGYKPDLMTEQHPEPTFMEPFFHRQNSSGPCRRREELLDRHVWRQKGTERGEAGKAAWEAERYADRLELIQSVHHVCGEAVDWSRIASLAPPFRRGEKGPREQAAETRYAEFKPTRLQKLLKQDAAVRQELEEQLAQAKEQDRREYAAWKHATDFARDIMEGHRTAYLRVLEEFAPLNDLPALGSGLEFVVLDPKTVEVELDVHSGQIIPHESKRLTEEGELAAAPLDAEARNALEYEYVCGCVLRIARELLMILPLETVLVHARDTKMNRDSGQEEYVTVLSIRLDRDTLSRLDVAPGSYPRVLGHFTHRVRFDPAGGFAPVEPLEAWA
ncbi:hypothetical protein NYE48_19790 [Paenibacillus sp. FSL M7-1455]|uniref:hypothetical protein n=1 Tax=Paenibacillus sp. FSL M7-1455 TaxID=2975316 RepID=UPI0030F9A6BF